MTAEITLSNGMVALVSAEDFEFLSKFRWSVQPKDASTGGFYAVRYDSATGRTAYMHRTILCAPQNAVVDHINGNGLDNRRENIRLANRSLNNANRSGYAPRSGFRGVYPTAEGRWRVRIWSYGKSINGGVFDNKKDAALAYDALATKEFGRFATLNFPKPHNQKD